MTLARQHIELPVHQRVGGFPDRRRRSRGNADRQHRRHQPAADLVAIKPDDGIDAPDFEQSDEPDKGDDPRDDLAQQRQIAIGAGLEPREALQDIRADPEAAIDHAQHHDGGKTRDQDDRDGADEILQQQRIAVADIERPHRPQSYDNHDRRNVPQAGDPVARLRGDALAAVRPAYRGGDLAAALQDDDDNKEMHDQHHQAQQRDVAGMVQAEQQRHVRKGDAGDADADNAPRPNLDIGRGLRPNAKQAERPRQRPRHADQPTRQRIGIDHREDHKPRGRAFAEGCAQQHRSDPDKDDDREQFEQQTPQHERQPDQRLPDPDEIDTALMLFGLRAHVARVRRWIGGS